MSEDEGRINIKIEIKRNLDGKTTTGVWRDHYYSDYWWEDGNASCDCNRGLFFERFLGNDDPDDQKCLHGGYSVRVSNHDTGVVLYDEF